MFVGGSRQPESSNPHAAVSVALDQIINKKW